VSKQLLDNHIKIWLLMFLNSFLDESKNTDLIRWSERGDSFVVLDEDEFAKTLIPELFKHNNYASFVRQLNMYGFHKRVGLSDNSMKASERKNKTPSEYYNPYFKRGHPNLLWLINKPKGGTGQKKGKGAARVKAEDGGEGESDDDNKDGVEENFGTGYGQNSTQGNSRAISAAPESGPLQKREMALVQNQLHEIQKQQNAISSAIARLRKDHNSLYQQAVAFQTLHDRHETSISAILTFLATVYNRSLDGQGGANIAQMFANAIPQDQQQQGNVVDMGDFSNQQQNPGSLSPHRRQQRLLMAPPAAGSQTPTQHQMDTASQYQNLNIPQHGAIEELFETSPDGGSPLIKSELDPLPQQNQMMNIIHNANAQGPRQGAKTMAFPDVLSHFETSNGNSPLTSEQRNDMLSLIANTTSTPGSNNALVSPTPPPAPNLDQFSYTQAELDELMRMQAEQDNKIHEVSTLLQPLSPSGSIPGLTESGYFPDVNASPGAGNLDLDQYLDTGAYYTNGENGDYGYDNLNFGNSDPSAFDFGLDGAVDGVGAGAAGSTGDVGRIVETTRTSSEDSDGKGATDEVLSVGARSPSKKRRKA
jgi:heat shock transcription factor